MADPVNYIIVKIEQTSAKREEVCEERWSARLFCIFLDSVFDPSLSEG